MKPTDILLLRFDLQSLREAGGLLGLVRWFEVNVRGRELGDGAPAFLLLDEIHKLPRWNEEVKHLGEITRARMVITGSSSVLVAKGTRESLAGRVVTTELPAFPFREVLEAWHPELTPPVAPLRFLATFDAAARGVFRELHAFAEANARALSTALDRYYLRGGYPRLHSSEYETDGWADYPVARRLLPSAGTSTLHAVAASTIVPPTSAHGPGRSPTARYAQIGLRTGSRSIRSEASTAVTPLSPRAKQT